MTNTISEATQIKIVQSITKELGVGPSQVTAAVALLDEGSTVPFIARYRKEATGNLDDTQLRNLEERMLHLREFLSSGIEAMLIAAGKGFASITRNPHALRNVTSLNSRS